MKPLIPAFFLASLIFLSCMEPAKQSAETEVSSAPLDIQGHRGCRGLLPENTIPAFRKALELGVQTLELDVVITADSLVVVSHEPFFNHEMSLKPDGSEISEEEERSHNLYQMDYATAANYDVGQKPHPRFPEQEKMAVAKPLLSEVIANAEAYAKELGRELPFYNIETKTTPAGDNSFHPEPEPFVDLLIGVIKEGGIAERTYIQSFDVRTLQVMQQKYADIPLVLLVENEESAQANLDKLGFKPTVYSPWFKYVDEELVAFCKAENMLLIPWTLNEEAEIKRALALGVDGIISDFPDRVITLSKK
ncbi:MAG: glycerophosphodiester phosphodiesterase family protein [Bacteroidota bacterium]